MIRDSLYLHLPLQLRPVARKLYYHFRDRPMLVAPDNTIHWVSPDSIIWMCQDGTGFHIANQAGLSIGGDWDDFPKSKRFTEIDTFKAVQSRLNGTPWQETIYYHRVVRQIESGETMWSCQSKSEFDERCAKWDDLITSIRGNGYQLQPSDKAHDEIAVNIGRHGDLLFNNGGHRLAIAKLLGIKQIPIRITVRHPQWVAFKNEILHYAQANSGVVYAPLLHPDLEDIPYCHTPERFDIIKANISPAPATVLDLGAHWGYFCQRFSALGYQCTAVEHGVRNARFMTLLRRATNTDFNIMAADLFDLPHYRYNTILALSIFHHFLLTEESYTKFLALLPKLDCQELIVEMNYPNEHQMQDAYMKLEPYQLADTILYHSPLKKCQCLGETTDNSGSTRPIYKFWR